MSDYAGQEPSLEELVKQSKKKANRSFFTTFVAIFAVVAALITAGPQWVDRFGAWRENVSSGSLKEAEAQSALWRKNFECTQTPYKWVQTENNLKVDATVCPSGDIFIRVVRSDGTQFFKWVPVDSVVQPAGGVIPSAHA